MDTLVGETQGDKETCYFYSKRRSSYTLALFLTIPVPSFLVPTPYNKGGGCQLDPPAISKTVVPMNMKFRMVLETSLNVPEMLKFFYMVIKCLP